METVEAVVIAQIQEVPVDIPDIIIGVFFDLIRKKGNGTLFTRVDHAADFQNIRLKAGLDICFSVALF